MTKKEQLKDWIICLNESIYRIWFWHLDKILMLILLLLLCVITVVIYWNLFKTKKGYEEIKKDIIEYKKNAYARGESKDMVLFDIYYCWYYKDLFPDSKSKKNEFLIK